MVARVCISLGTGVNSKISVSYSYPSIHLFNILSSSYVSISLIFVIFRNIKHFTIDMRSYLTPNFIVPECSCIVLSDLAAIGAEAVSQKIAYLRAKFRPTVIVSLLSSDIKAAYDV